MAARKRYEVTIPMMVVEDGKDLVSYCPALELASLIESPNRPRKIFEEAKEVSVTFGFPWFQFA